MTGSHAGHRMHCCFY